MTNSRAYVHKSLNGEMLPLHSGILAKAISIASSSLQQIQSMSLALLLQCLHSRSSRPELFCKKIVLKNFEKFVGVSSGTGVSCEFCNILKNTFFAEHLQWLLLAFAPIKIFYSNTVCNKSAVEAWICLVSWYGGAKDFIFTYIFPRIVTFLRLKKITLVSGNAGDEKNLHPGGCKFMF